MRTQRHTKGYILVYRPDHPYCNHQGFVPEHRLVAEDFLGKTIDPLVYDVHHVDGDVVNNHPSNLQVLTKKEHRRVHAGWGLYNGRWWKPCSGCYRSLPVQGNFYKRKSKSSHNDFVSRCRNCW